MKDDFELVRGNGNVFRDFGHPDAGIQHAKALLAAAIIKTLDDRHGRPAKLSRKPASTTPTLPASAI